MPEPLENMTYAFQAIEHMDEKWDRLYDIWLQAAEQHASAQNRTSVQLTDVRATIVEAANKWLEESNPALPD